MKPAFHPLSRAAALLVSATLSVATASWAQTPAQPAAVPAQAGGNPNARPDQSIERIRTEDAGSRIDELRVGGETKNITVQPKSGNGNAPAYEVRPENARGNAPSNSSGDTNGSRVWNIFKF